MCTSRQQACALCVSSPTGEIRLRSEHVKKPDTSRVVRDELFATDVDGATIVHWLGDRSRSLHKKVVATDLASRAARTVQEQLRQARQRKNELLVRRYERLWAYMSRHLPAWGVEPSLNEET